MAIKERRTKILLSILLLSDLSSDSYVNLDEKVQKIFDFSFNQKTRGTISGMIKEGLIKKTVKKTDSVLGNSPSETESVKYSLTDKGFLELCLKFPFFRFLKEKWDGRWRIISYEIPEKQREIRDRLRREMQGWGLGPWHRSFWLTPHPVIDNLKELVFGRQEEKYIQAFESQHIFGDREILIEKVWGKTVLEKKYREMFKKWHDILSGAGDKIEKFQTVINQYVDLLRQDPGLPKELVGDNWIGFEAFNIFKEIKNILLS